MPSLTRKQTDSKRIIQYSIEIHLEANCRRRYSRPTKPFCSLFNLLRSNCQDRLPCEAFKCTSSKSYQLGLFDLNAHHSQAPELLVSLL